MTPHRVAMTDLLVDNTGPVRRLTLHRPSRRNALSPELVAELTAALRDADHDPAVHVIVIDGAPSTDGRATFCAGGDLGANLATTPHFAEQHAARAGFAELLLTFHRLGTPTIAAVDGVALGGGFGLVLACDIAVVSTTARLGTPEVKRGLFPMMISAFIDEVLPRKAAMELMLTGGEVDGARAVELGIANHVVAAEHVLPRAFEVANAIAALSPAVLSLGRRAVQQQRGMSFEQKLLFLRDQLTINLQLDDAAEGVAAFMQKREPRWMGR
jgi:enoyl-CoA hydratase/carnithine racemase